MSATKFPIWIDAQKAHFSHWLLLSCLSCSSAAFAHWLFVHIYAEYFLSQTDASYGVFLCIFFMSQLPLSIHWPTLSLTCPFFHRTQSENCFHFLRILHSFGIFPKYNCHFTDRLFSDTPFLQWHSVTEMLQMQCNWSTLTLAFVLRHPLPHCPNYLFPPSVPHRYHFNQTLKAPFLGLRSDLKGLLVLWEGFLY